MTTTALIYGYHDFKGETTQQVEILYSGTGQTKFIVDSLQVMTKIELEPSDLYEDLCTAIMNDQGADGARIECEIETYAPSKFSFLLEEQEHLFIGGVPNY